MQCPSCHKAELHYSQLATNLPCQTCDNCDGNWLLLTDYLGWQSSVKSAPIGNDQDIAEIAIDDSQQALICPVSGTLMTKYRISSKTTHRLDISMAANGIWLDKGEWQLLKEEGLANKLNHIFTEPWQRKIRNELTSESFIELYRRQFGQANYQQLKAFRTWLNNQPKRSEMLAYLLADDPYSAIR